VLFYQELICKALTNKREDEYGKDLTKWGREIIEAAKAEIPKDMPVMMRVSAK
jgi:NADPH2 dehydrogenase